MKIIADIAIRQNVIIKQGNKLSHVPFARITIKVIKNLVMGKCGICIISIKHDHLQYQHYFPCTFLPPTSMLYLEMQSDEWHPYIAFSLYFMRLIREILYIKKFTASAIILL